jgi:uncharacterized protein YbjT (DUF2867 family)
MSNDTQQTTLITGGTGKTGRRIVQRLRARGVPVRVGSRSGEPPFDWEDPSTWAPALRGASAAYLSYFPDLAVPGARDAVAAVSELAVEQGVRRLVLLSGRGEEEAQRAERAVQDSGAEWTVVRCSWFSQNFSEGYMVDAVLAGEIALPVGDMGEPFLDVDDIADVATRALAEDGHGGEVYELTGPRLLSFADAVDEIAGASGRPLRFVSIPLEDFAAGAAEQGLPDDVLGLMTYLFTEVLDGRNAHTNDGVQRALGREPRDFREFARGAAAAGAWNSTPTTEGTPR